MKKIERAKRFILGAAISLVLTLMLTPAIAESIDVMFNAINIKINSVQVASVGQSYRLDSGEEVPFSILYKGTTYLPLRKIGELYDKDVQWDGASNTVLVSDLGYVAQPSVPEPVFDADIVLPLLHNIGVALAYPHVTDFDMARRQDADRMFTDALLYEFLNLGMYDPSINVELDEDTYLFVINEADMMRLMRGYIGDYPALMQPPADVFISQTEKGDYTYGRSDGGEIGYEMMITGVSYFGGGIFDVTASLYQVDNSEGPDSDATLYQRYLLRFMEEDEAIYGYNIISCTPF